MDMSAIKQADLEHQKNLARIKAFRLLDDIFFNKCLEDARDCVELILRIILNMPDLTVIEVRTQVSVDNLLNRSLRLDILATDSTGARFNIEIQRSDTGAGQRRARFHSSMMDTHLLHKGQDFDALPETYVIFITENDVIGYGKPLYRIERWIEDIGVRFMDGAHIVYVNGAYRGESPIGKLMHDFACADPSEMYYEVLAERVKYFKENKKGMDSMCKILEEMQNEYIQKGIELSKKESALYMLKTGKYSLEEIRDIFGFSLSEIKKLQINENPHLN